MSNLLNEVIIVSDLPITISGDTISYRVNAFTSGNEKKLKDVLKKLPGFEVDDHGNIKVQGRRVNKLKVDGREFFSGDTKLATKNIPSNIIEKVNILRNFSDIQPLKGLTDEDEYVIDIRLKSGKKNILFGSLEAGVGLKERNNGHINLFYYNPTISINFIGNANNIGKQVLTFQDFFKFNGGFKNAGNKSKSSFNLSSDLLGLTVLKENKAQNTTSKLGALNYTFNPSNKLSFSGFLIHSEIDYNITSSNLKTYIREDENNKEKLVSNTIQGSVSDIIKISSKYIPSNKLHLEYDALINSTRLNNNSRLRSEIQNSINDITSLNSNKPFSFQQKLGIYYAQNEKNIYSLDVSSQYKNQSNPFKLDLEEKPFSSSIPFIDSDNYNILQNKNIITNGFSTSLNYYYVINKTNHINFFTGVEYNSQRLKSNIVQTVEDSQINFTENYLLNNTKFNYIDSYLGLNYRTKLNKLIINSGLTLHFYNLENKQIESDYRFTERMLLPNFKLRYDFKKARTLTLNYNISAEFVDIQKLTAGNIIQSYNTLFKGNQELKNATYHNFNLDYYDFNAYNFSNLYTVISYQIKQDDINNILFYNNYNSISTPINIKNPNKILTGYFSYDRRFRKIKINASASLVSFKFRNIIDDILVTNESITQIYKFSFETRIDNLPILELGFEKVLSNYKSTIVSSQSYDINRLFANLEITFLKCFIAVIDYDYTIYKSKTSNSSSEYDFLNAYIYYKKENSSFEFKLSSLNLLNTATIRKDAFSNNFISTSEYFVQPQYFLVSISYDL